jgi:hypothetical protein
MEVVKLVADAVLSSGAKIDNFTVDLEESYIEDWDGLHVKSFAKHYLSVKCPRLTFAHLRCLDLTLQNVNLGHKYVSKLTHFLEPLPLLRNLTLRWVKGSLFPDGTVEYLAEKSILSKLRRFEIQIVKLSVTKLLKFIKSHPRLESLTLREISFEYGEDWQEFFQSLKHSHGSLHHLKAVSVSCAKWLVHSTSRRPAKLFMPKETENIDIYINLALESMALQTAAVAAKDDSNSSSDSDSDSSESNSTDPDSGSDSEAEESVPVPGHFLNYEPDHQLVSGSNHVNNHIFNHEPGYQSIEPIHKSNHDSAISTDGDNDFMRHTRAWRAWKARPASALANAPR